MLCKSEKAEDLLKEWKEKLKLNEGLEIDSTSVILVKSDLFFSLYERITRIVGAPAATLLYFVGEDYGKSVYRDFAEEADEETLKKLCDFTKATGIGDVEIEIDENSNEIYITASKGFPIGKRAKGRAADSYFAGYFAGFFSELYHKKYEGTEEECLAKGDDRCRIVLKEKEE